MQLISINMKLFWTMAVLFVVTCIIMGFMVGNQMQMVANQKEMVANQKEMVANQKEMVANQREMVMQLKSLNEVLHITK